MGFWKRLLPSNNLGEYGGLIDKIGSSSKLLTSRPGSSPQAHYQESHTNVCFTPTHYYSSQGTTVMTSNCRTVVLKDTWKVTDALSLLYKKKVFREKRRQRKRTHLWKTSSRTPHFPFIQVMCYSLDMSGENILACWWHEMSDFLKNKTVAIQNNHLRHVKSSFQLLHPMYVSVHMHPCVHVYVCAHHLLTVNEGNYFQF